uniref:GMP synthase (glutamine-hydrolyzing) n=1 Tax=Aureoumbra lagunensis TaxID=44058 RepID=A0A7S3JT39_9STRA|mmetsp:Transcript_20876/g.27077  ORF Transcript_20876/g.27077 Transcript_20876/m.27077 type:complete len:648 (+) Transcript_20876:50-1993(+)
MKTIYVLDCGGQYCHLLASRIRRHEAFSAVVPCEISAEDLSDACGVIISGGPQSVFEESSPRVDSKIWSLPVPLLGICYGCQMMCQDLGGIVKNSDHGEYGAAELHCTVETNGLIPSGKRVVWMSHRDIVTRLPDGMETIATTEHSPHAAVKLIGKPVFGVQFHPEVRHTSDGEKILGNFVDLCQARGSWRPENFLQVQIKNIATRVLESDTDENKEQPSKKKAKLTRKKKAVFMLVSGGVDSTVAFAMIAKALPAERVRGLYVDTGMMRLDESRTVRESLEQAGLGAGLSCVDASERFLTALDGVTAPEVKRRIIGREFINVQRDECAKLLHENDEYEWLLGQGTIYPDTIESGGKRDSSGSNRKADVIKTHHNRVAEIDALLEQGLVLEPLSELYKDEVRAVGEQLGLPHKMVWRQPFPGPGLGVRLLCCDAEDNHLLTVNSMATLRDQAVALLSQPEWQVHVPPLKSVGCQGDARTYRHFAVLTKYRQDWDEIATAATRLVNGHDDLNRVVISLKTNDSIEVHQGFSLTDSPPHTVTKSRLDILRRADHIATTFLADNGHLNNIWQCPVVMAPLKPTHLTSASNKEVIILRPVDSTEAMTAAFSRLPIPILHELAARLLEHLSDHVADVFYDVTNKPPGTIEWE